MPFDDSGGFKLTEKQVLQRDAAASSARHVLAFGGSRSGKTFGFCRCVATRGLMAPGSRHLIARLHNIDVRQAIMMDTWPSMMKACYPGVTYNENKTDQFITLDNGSEIWFGGLDDKERVEKILGKEFATVYPNECSQISYSSILTMRTRLAQKVKRLDGGYLKLKAYYDLNPVGKSHWSYSEFINGVSPADKALLPVGSRTHLQMNPYDNLENLPEGYMEELSTLPSRERQRFMDGNYLSEIPGTLWPVATLDACRVSKHPPLQRIVIGVDPSGSNGVGGDMQGIVAVGYGNDGHGYLLEDASCHKSPAGWGRQAVDLYGKWGADCIAAENNYGGAMVESTIKTADPFAKVKMVNASRGKHVRAEPIAALYEETPGQVCRVHHVGAYPELEDQMTSFTTKGYQGQGSPDRADALVWALTELMLGENNSWVGTV